MQKNLSQVKWHTNSARFNLTWLACMTMYSSWVIGWPMNQVIQVYVYTRTNSRTPSINAQCQSMPLKILALIPMSINSDQCRSKFWHNVLTVFTNVLLMPWSGIDRHWEELIGIDRNWSAVRGISDQCHDFDRHWSALGIDWGSLVIAN